MPGQEPPQSLSDLGRAGLFGAGDHVRHQPLGAVLGVGTRSQRRHGDGLGDVGQREQGSVHLAGLDQVAADLHAVVTPAQQPQHPSGRSGLEHPDVAGAIRPGAIGVGGEGLRGVLRVVEVPRGHERRGHGQHPGLAVRVLGAVGRGDAQHGVTHGMADRQRAVQHRVVGGHRVLGDQSGLARAVPVAHHAGWWQQRAGRLHVPAVGSLPGDGQRPQTGQQGGVGTGADEGPQNGWAGVHHGGADPVQPSRQPGDPRAPDVVQLHPGADHQPGDGDHETGVEGEGEGVGHHVVRVVAAGVDRVGPGVTGEHAVVVDDDLGNPGRAGGEGERSG